MAVKNYLDKDGLSHVASYVNGKLTVVSSMPTLPTDLRTVLYIGPTTDDYAQGGIYILDTITNEWILISTADVSLYETSWTGTRDEWIALSADEQAKYEIVNITDDFGPMGDHVISGYYYNGQFYEDAEHTTLIVPEVSFIYIDLPYDDLYLYDDTESAYVLAGGGGADSIVYVETLPSSNIENVLYGLKTSTAYDLMIADGFLDSNELFVRTDGTGDDYVYTASSGITLQASEDDTEYKDFTSLEFDGTDWILTFGDSTTATLADGDTFYFKQIQTLFYAGNEDEQSLTPLASSESSGGATYFAGEGINISSHVISVSPATPSTLGGIKPDNTTVEVTAAGTLKGNYQAGYGIKVNVNEISAKTFVGTTAEWNALTPAEQAAFDTVSITDDGSTINNTAGHTIEDDTTAFPQRSNLKFEDATVTDDSVNDTTVITHTPYTAGDKIDITDHVVGCDETVKGTFVGTTAEWDALPAADKAKYEVVNLTDDATTPTIVVDTVADGNMNAVTSNAVAEKVAKINDDLSIKNSY